MVELRAGKSLRRSKKKHVKMPLTSSAAAENDQQQQEDEQDQVTNSIWTYHDEKRLLGTLLT